VASVDDETIGKEQRWNDNEGVKRNGTWPVAVPDQQEQNRISEPAISTVLGAAQYPCTHQRTRHCNSSLSSFKGLCGQFSVCSVRLIMASVHVM
jgi:hypothetical protein